MRCRRGRRRLRTSGAWEGPSFHRAFHRECEWAGRPMDNLTLSGIVCIKVTESDLRRKGSRMNFGKHGRAVLLGGLLVSTSTLVFGGLLGGIATAAPGTIKVGGIPAEQGGNGNDPHVNTACIGIREFGFVPGVPTTATFSTQGAADPPRIRGAGADQGRRIADGHG